MSGAEYTELAVDGITPHFILCTDFFTAYSLVRKFKALRAILSSIMMLSAIPFPALPTPPSWFPGHMNRFTKQLPALLSRTDVVLELRDARLPLTSINHNLERESQVPLSFDWSLSIQGSDIFILSSHAVTPITG